ncbi:MAG: MoxR family ATPase [Nitrospiraceae bacterium]
MTTTATTIRAIHDNIERVIKGKSEVIELALVCLFARGHLLIEDVPGVGKTTLAHSVARTIDCAFKRIQFTSDLLPSDIVGVSIFNRQKQGFEFMRGPIFANIVLADEINRTTPKTQSSLLEAMSEAQISVDNQTYPLQQPFMVIATQNPSDFHGTFPLPESQLDRFLMRLHIGYPTLQEERKVLDRPQSLHPADELQPVVTAQQVIDLQELVEKVRLEDSLLDYLLSIVQATRQTDLLTLGVSTRGALALTRAAKALALVRGRNFCIPDDIKYLAPIVLAHRVMLNRAHVGTMVDSNTASRTTRPTQASNAAHTNGAVTRADDPAVRVIRDLLNTIPVPL